MLGKKDSFDRTKDTVLLKDTLAKNKLMDSLARKNDTLMALILAMVFLYVRRYGTEELV